MDSPPYTMSKTKRRIYNMPTKRSGSIRKTILSTPCSASIICKGPKYRFPLPIYFISCQEEIAVALKEFYNRWCKREHVESNALNSWKLNILRLLMVELHFIATI